MSPLTWLILYLVVGMIFGLVHVIRRARQNYYDHEAGEAILITAFWPFHLLYLLYWGIGQLFDSHRH